MIELIVIDTTDKKCWEENFFKLKERFDLSGLYNDFEYDENYNLFIALVNITGGIEKNNIAHVTINYDREYNPIMCSNADELFEIYDNIEKYNTAYKLGLL